MTVALTVHEPPAGIVALATASVVPPLAADTVAPTQVEAPPAGVEFSTPAGYVSVNVAPVIGCGFGLVSVTVTVEVPPVAIVDGANALATVGCARTVMDPEAVAAVPAFVVVTVLVVLV